MMGPDRGTERIVVSDGGGGDRGNMDIGGDDPVVEGTWGSLAFAVGIWITLLYAVVVAFDFHPSARIIPHIAGIPALLFATIMVAREVTWLRARLVDDSRSPQRGSLTAEFEAFAWFIGYSVGVILLGFALASPIFMVAFLRLYGRQPWLRTVVLTSVVVGLTVFVFDGVFGIRVYDGWLPTLLRG